MARLEARGLTLRPWLAGRDLVVDAGEVVVLRGANGSGKSLFLRGLADLVPLDAGEIALDGVPRERFAPHEWRRRVLYVHQRAPRVGATVGEDLARVAGLAVHAGRTLAPPAGLAPDQPAATLSGGEAQRLALARALALEPEVLLLDETTSQLDDENARAAEARVAAFAARGGAVVWIAHDEDLAPRLAAHAGLRVRAEPFP